MVIMLQNPRNVQGHSPNPRPATTYAVNTLDSRTSRAAANSKFSREAGSARSSSTVIREHTLDAPFHLNRAWKENVIFQMNVLMEIALKFRQSGIKLFEAGAGACWSAVPIAQTAHASQQVSRRIMFVDHACHRIAHSPERCRQNRFAANNSLFH